MIQNYMDSPDEPVNPFADDDAPKMHEEFLSQISTTAAIPPGPLTNFPTFLVCGPFRPPIRLVFGRPFNYIV